MMLQVYRVLLCCVCFLSVSIRHVSTAEEVSEEKVLRVLSSLPSHDRQRVEYLARTVFGEARGERDEEGMRAVAHVIINRALGSSLWPESVQAVVMQKKQFSCWNVSDPNALLMRKVGLASKDFRRAIWASLKALGSPDITHGATYYHAEYVRPRWRNQLQCVRKIGRHIFYK